MKLVQINSEEVLVSPVGKVATFALRFHVLGVPASRVFNPRLKVPRVHLLPVLDDSASKAAHASGVVGVLAPNPLGEPAVEGCDHF